MHTEEEYQALENTLKRTRKIQKKAEELLETKSRELYEANQALMHQQTQLIQQEKLASVGQLSAGIAHEINNPIGFITSNLSTLKDYHGDFKEGISSTLNFLQSAKNTPKEELSQLLEEFSSKVTADKFEFLMEDSDELLEETIDGCIRVKKIVQGLKNFVHLDSEVELKEVNLNDEIENTLNVIWNEIKYSVNEVKKDFQELPPVNCVGGQINQVLMNILVNASQAIEKDGTIEVKTIHQNNTVAIHITDNGTGIEEKNLLNLFQPFFTTKPVGKGTGLGLSISKGIIDAHRGDIRVHSKLGQGTTFIIELPVGLKELKEKD